jgi:hypothetical protein
MPGRDGTGPVGVGPTGGGFGFCNFNPGRKGWGRPRMGRCWGWFQNPTDQAQTLADYRQSLEKELAEVKQAEQKLKNQNQ